MSKLAQEMQRIADEIFKKVVPPLSREDRKAHRKTEEAFVITAVRAEVFLLDRACICGRCRPSDTDEMHEVVSRAKTRGLPPEVRFNTANCVRLSQACHRRVTGEVGRGKSMVITFADPIIGANGAVDIKMDGKVKTYRRKGRR